ncbi:hypothetical protein [Xanthomonas phage f20-Xaj]|uniref:Uncharacterized protein n=2 Tax=Pradovirus TaxID=1985733 RepID=A0A127AVM9_9CAUD|nr:hypothetical protein FDI07_gp06 [Xanthomonas phage f20-Xaj]YP_009276334.1 hypothetical protein FDI08_gp33 [Xanthomonas phage f30-Xaj]AMM44655.1 hypothetical protein [Xanthomonas phage f20-Xaj]AMM44720.1 hypothetical protein [Xanthomonas phage f30-Xaj]
MGFIDKIKTAARYVKDKFVQAVMPKRDDDDAPPPAPDTSRYLHVSVPLIPIDNPVLRKMLGQDYFPVQKGQGQTRIVGNNQLKRVADSLGDNNKQRRKLRSRMKRRAAELRAGASLYPSVQSALAGAA